ncbi:DUF2779 domain-containing protein [Spiroplasma culicicola]|uniref:DUF2779 domain-containing protein n=1 Tax=Spiroplasma culicicola AES-1 TaxID=1276246 RepID=W6A6W3_9MOLU|nr:DUF2779 domain-containing protein [Spiroplasma culicicola]AHI52717.1 hypothetical protein SCULI_v1c03760 [Spiroplasma culicicola AES-1]
MELKNKVSKEDFKRYMNDCSKLSWIFHSIDNFKKAIDFKKSHKISTKLKVELENSDEYNTAEGFEPLTLYERLLTASDLTKDELIQQKALLANIDNANGLELSPTPAETIIDGNAVGDAAREYFIADLYEYNREHKTQYQYFDFLQYGFAESVDLTRDILKDDTHRVLFEPSFEYGNSKLKIRCDILINKGNRHVEIIEVKGSTKEKKDHFYDLFYQWYLLKKLGYIIDSVKLCLINKNYYRGLGEIDPGLVLSLEEEFIDFEKEIKIPFLDNDFEVPNNDFKSDIEYSKLFVVSNTYNEQKIKPDYLAIFENIADKNDIDYLFEKIAAIYNDENFLLNEKCGKFKMDFKNETIDYKKAYCRHIFKYRNLDEFNVLNLPQMHTKVGEILWTRDFFYLKDIQDPFDKKYTDSQNKPIFSATNARLINLTNQYLKNNCQTSPDMIVDMNRIDDIVDLLKDYYQYPVYMYDFETSKWAVPNFNKSKSYMQIPFQYSIHTILDDKYDFKNSQATMKHANFIANSQNDPRPEFIQKFIKDSFEFGPGIYVAYNKSFEKMVLRQLIQLFPEYRKPLHYIWQNTIDLRDFFAKAQNNWLIYHPEFKGKSSIKITQPVLDGSLSYKDLRINKGDKASQVFRQFADDFFTQEQWENIFKKDMLAYCDRDTLAMVVVLQKVVELIKEIDPMLIETIKKGES